MDEETSKKTHSQQAAQERSAAFGIVINFSCLLQHDGEISTHMHELVEQLIKIKSLLIEEKEKCCQQP